MGCESLGAPLGRATAAALHLSDGPGVWEVRSYWVLTG
jgi:hypothetical protein